MLTPSSVAFGPFEFNAASFRVLRDGMPVPLEPKAIDVLRLLLERAPGVVGKSEIFAVVWKDVAVTDNALTRVVAQLRKALDDDAKNPRYIETVATRGYRMVAAVRAVPASTPADAAERPVVVSGFSRTFLFQRGSWLGLIGLFACALLMAAVLRPLWWRATAGSVDQVGPTLRNSHLELALARPVQVTTGTGYDGMPAYSPDGTSLAYASDRSGAFEIYVQQLVAGAAPTPLTSNGRQNVQPAWSPDGKFIAFHEATGGGIWVMPSRGGTARRLVETGSRPAWSPDGALIAFQSVDAAEVTMVSVPTFLSDIRTVDPVSGNVRALTRSGAPAGPHVAPRWSSDGRHLYFVETPAPYLSALGEAQSRIWRVGADGSGLTRVAGGSLLTSEYALARHETGAWAVMRTATIWWQPFSATASTLTSAPTGLTMPGMPAQLALTPDGRTLAWTARASVTNLWAAPDGRLAYLGTVQGNASQIWVRDEEGGMRQVTTDDGDHFIPFWLSGYREVAFCSAHQGVAGYHAVDVTTGRERQLFRMADLPLPGSTALHPLVSLNVVPDVQLRRVVATLVKDGVPNLWLFRLSGGRFETEAMPLTFEAKGARSRTGRRMAGRCRTSAAKA